jgi:internalin A
MPQDNAPTPMINAELLSAIQHARRTGQQELNLSGQGIGVLPPEIGTLDQLRELNLAGNHLEVLPEEIGDLRGLQQLDLSSNRLTSIPSSIGNLEGLKGFDLRSNKLTALPDSIGNLRELEALQLNVNALERLPATLGKLANLRKLLLNTNRFERVPDQVWELVHLQVLSLGGSFETLPVEITRLRILQSLYIFDTPLRSLPDELALLDKLDSLILNTTRLAAFPLSICMLPALNRLTIENRSWQPGSLKRLPNQIANLTNLISLNVSGQALQQIPESIGGLTQLVSLKLSNNDLTALPATIGNLHGLQRLSLEYNQLRQLPSSLANLQQLENLWLEGNPLDSALQSAYTAGLDELRAYLGSLEDAQPLFEAKLVLVGEGGVGKTTLLKALSGGAPVRGEPTTHGVAIQVEALHIPHPARPGTAIQFNAWDFGGQEVYRVTHQFFFSHRAVYLVVWEPRMGTHQGQVEEWLKLIRLRVGESARVIIVSTHCKTGERIARIDQPALRREFGGMIVDFHEVDSLTDDPLTGEKVGISELRSRIAHAAQDLEQMGLPFSSRWKNARDELLRIGRAEPHISFARLTQICEDTGLTPVAARTLAILLNDLGYIVYYADDEHLRDDVVLQPEWLTKAIGFVLEDGTTQRMEGILPDDRLTDVWFNHAFAREPRFEPRHYPFFLRLMQKYDVSYRLDSGTASLVAQHVPQVRPELPWSADLLPHPGKRRISLVCVMDESPPGLVPWMIVRTHAYAGESTGPDGSRHRLHWQKGMFLSHGSHGEALLELNGREFHLLAQASWPEYFMNVLRQTLQKLIVDNWPGLEDKYHFAVPCHGTLAGGRCTGLFDLDALSEFLNEGDERIRCQTCRSHQNIKELLFGFEEEDSRAQLSRIEAKLDVGFSDVEKAIEGLGSRLNNHVMAIMRAMANEAREGPRLFTLEPVEGWSRLSPKRLFTSRYRLHLWCEAEGCQHPLHLDASAGPDAGTYEFEASREWLSAVAPYANFIVGVLKTLVPLIGPAVTVYFGSDRVDEAGLKDHLDLAKEGTDKLLRQVNVLDPEQTPASVLTHSERSGLWRCTHSFAHTIPTTPVSASSATPPTRAITCGCARATMKRCSRPSRTGSRARPSTWPSCLPLSKLLPRSHKHASGVWERTRSGGGTNPILRSSIVPDGGRCVPSRSVRGVRRGSRVAPHPPREVRPASRQNDGRYGST